MSKKRRGRGQVPTSNYITRYGGSQSPAKKRKLSNGSSVSIRPESNGSHYHSRDPEPGDWQTVRNKRDHYRKSRHETTNDQICAPKVYRKRDWGGRVDLKDLQQLVLYALTDQRAPDFVAVQNSKAIKKVVVMMVPGSEAKEIEAYQKSQAETTQNAATQECRDFAIATEAVVGAAARNEEENQNSERKRQDGQEETKPDPKFLDGSLTVYAPTDQRQTKVYSPLQAMLLAMRPEPPNRHESRNKHDQSFKAVRTPLAAFIHTAEDLVEAEYPVHPAAFTSDIDASLEKERRHKTGQYIVDGWVDTNVTSNIPIISQEFTRTDDPAANGLQVYSIDCEMVLTTDDVYSLARISILSWDGKVIMDKFVKPDLPIKNYFTQYSGVTPELLENVITTLKDIQTELLSLLTPSTVILGHSLESDLNALKLTHPFVIDTSLIFPHPRGLPLRSSLKYLANKYLKREIQLGGANGHDSVEDARAVLDLVRLKCEKGPLFGTLEAGGETIFARLASNKKTSAIIEYGTPERGFGKDATVAIGCGSDDEIIDGVIAAVNGCPAGENEDSKYMNIPAGGVDFVWGRLRDLEVAKGWSCPGSGPPNPPNLDTSASTSTTNSSTNTNTDSASIPESTNQSSSTSPQPQPQPQPQPNTQPQSQIERTMTLLHKLHPSLPPATLLVLYSGTGDMRPVLELQQKQAQYRKEFKIKKWNELTVQWTDTEEQMLVQAVRDASRGWGWVGVV